jgi:hypothetical protein
MISIKLPSPRKYFATQTKHHCCVEPYAVVMATAIKVIIQEGAGFISSMNPLREWIASVKTQTWKAQTKRWNPQNSRSQNRSIAGSCAREAE